MIHESINGITSQGIKFKVAELCNNEVTTVCVSQT